jgi:hypothetical protein
MTMGSIQYLLSRVSSLGSLQKRLQAPQVFIFAMVCISHRIFIWTRAAYDLMHCHLVPRGSRQLALNRQRLSIH